MRTGAMACEPAGDGTDTPDRKMADPLSITCDVLTLVTFALSSSVMLRQQYAASNTTTRNHER